MSSQKEYEMSVVTAQANPSDQDHSTDRWSEAHVETAGATDRRVMLSTLWLFAVLNYLYADVLSLFFNPTLIEEARTFTGGSPLIVLAGAVLMETAIAMVLLSRLLRYRANRWANIAAGVLQTAAVAGSLSLAPYYVFFATIEIACTLFVVWYAWTWRRPVDRPLRAAGGLLGGMK
jgi:hypothetical protein